MTIKLVAVGSLNPLKVGAVAAALRRYPHLERAELRAHAAASGVPAQPWALDDVWVGAANRAGRALEAAGADLGVGLESGVWRVRDPRHPLVYRGPDCWLDACACVLVARGGRVVGAGLSSAFEVPPRVVAKMREGLEMCDALAALGIAPADAGREGTGAVGACTRDRVTRAHQVEQALLAALARLDRPDLYG